MLSFVDCNSYVTIYSFSFATEEENVVEKTRILK